MSTTNQLMRGARKHQRRKTKTRALHGCPQKCGVVLRVTVIKPKKPNSANRAVCRVRLTNGEEVWAYLPGEKMGANVQEHAVVLVQGGRRPDLPGLKYKVIPNGQKLVKGAEGHMDQQRPFRRNKARSKYGVSMLR